MDGRAQAGGQDGLFRGRCPIVSNPASRDVIGSMVNDVMLGQKTVPQACADANKEIVDLIAKE